MGLSSATSSKYWLLSALKRGDRGGAERLSFSFRFEISEEIKPAALATVWRKTRLLRQFKSSCIVSFSSILACLRIPRLMVIKLSRLILLNRCLNTALIVLISLSLPSVSMTITSSEGGLLSILAGSEISFESISWS